MTTPFGAAHIHIAHIKPNIPHILLLGGRDGTVARVLASQQCGPGLISGLSLFLILQISSLHKKQHLQIPNLFDQDRGTHENQLRLMWPPFSLFLNVLIYL